MFSLENGQQYALSSNSSADLLQVESKTYVFLKLTDSAFRAIEDYQAHAKKNSKQFNRPKIQFKGDSGVIKIPASHDDARSYKFTLSQLDSNTSTTCIRHDGIRSSSREIETLGTMGHKITICADDDVYQQTKAKMTQAEEENKRICTKEIKPSAGSKYRAKLNKKISNKSPVPLVTKPEIKSSIMDRILAQKAQNLKSADAKPARIAHKPKLADTPLAVKTETKPIAKVETKPISKLETKPEVRTISKVEAKAILESKAKTILETKAKTILETKAKVESSEAGKVRPPFTQPTFPGLDRSPNLREESAKRPAPPLETIAAKKPRCSDSDQERSDIVENAASHWKKQPLNQTSRNFFSDRRSPDFRPKLAVPPMPAPKPTDTIHDAKREESMKENQNIEAEDQYLKEYTEIRSMAQRLKYKQDFNSEYEEYQKLHAKISAVSRKFQRMERDLKSEPEGTKMHEKIKKAIVQEYINCKRDQRYVNDKSRFDYLHNKLSHVKKLIVDFDQRQITSK